MNKKKILILSIFLIILAMISLTSCSKKNELIEDSTDPERTFTYFISKQDGVGVGGKYATYEENPSIKYLTKDPFTYRSATKEGDEYVLGEEVTNKVALKFTSATLGQEQNGFITNLNNNVDILDLNYTPETVQRMYSGGKLMDLTFWVENYMPNYLALAEKFGLSELIASRDENGNKIYLQIFSIYENVNWQYYGYQYRRDWVLNYGKTFDIKTGSIGNNTFKEVNPEWGWTSINGEKTWNDEIKFPSYYGFKYESDKDALGVGKLTFDQELYDYIHGEYTQYSLDRAAEVENVLAQVQRDFETYNGQWPATISDWEWMLDIFQIAVNDLFKDRGYPMALYQAGYIATGNLISSFGETGAEWQNYNGEVILGTDRSAFKVYVETMRDWYQNGWIDKNFQSHSDLMWRTDEANVRQGYVGLYFGMNDQLFDGMDIGAGNTKDIYTSGMPYPINDKYGDAENKYKMPKTLYAANYETDSIMVSKACDESGKDLAALFTLLDENFTEAAGARKSWGLTEEMLTESDDAVKKIYKDLGYPNGTVVYNSETDSYYRSEDALDVLIDDQYVVSSRRINGLEGAVLGYDQKPRDQYENYIWNYFKDEGFLTKSFYANLNDNQYSLYTDKVGQFRSTLTVDIPKFIKGSKSMDEYEKWYASLKSSLGLDNITRMINNKYQQIFSEK